MSRKKSRLLQRVEYLAYRGVTRAVARMSEESVLRWGTRIGKLAAKVLRGRDRLAMRNLRGAFPERPEAELRRILDGSWQHFGREALLYLKVQSMPLAEIAARCPYINDHLLHEARARGKGTLILSGHYGGWEIAHLALMAHVDNVRTVVRPLDNELLEADLVKQRASTGAQVVDRRKAARFLLKGLAENAVVALLADQAVQPREGILVPFLGRPAWTTDAPAKMAARHGSTIVFAFCIPDGSGHRLEFEEPIRVDQLSEDERDPVALTRRINDIISRRIAAWPELWLWMHDRWKGTGESGAHGKQ
jgi:KDO2-lipid IV(A) lauroyltransferase